MAYDIFDTVSIYYCLLLFFSFRPDFYDCRRICTHRPPQLRSSLPLLRSDRSQRKILYMCIRKYKRWFLLFSIFDCLSNSFPSYLGFLFRCPVAREIRTSLTMLAVCWLGIQSLVMASRHTVAAAATAAASRYARPPFQYNFMTNWIQ